ncbi:HNH endonuclease [Microbacterium sp. P26]|uniref:HNH endonuclease n=1 Tax=Microbacterium TaxID=33882 RepID=UPI00203AFE40|nr:HNH endonuclease signature motif containing protein [Microbacterium sp. P26]MCM3500926.1 HNH endonuclease [Microbacterium sp. P26]
MYTLSPASFSRLSQVTPTASAASTTVVIVVFVVLALAAAVVAAVLVIRARRRRIVADTSTALSELTTLNIRYAEAVTPLSVIRLDFGFRAPTKAKFDQFDLDGFGRSNVLEQETALEKAIAVRRTVLRTYSMYSDDVVTLGGQHIGHSSDDRLRSDTYLKIEKSLFNKRILARPTPLAKVEISATYTSPQGRNSYARSTVWDFDELARNLSTAQAIRAERGTVSYLRSKERSLLTSRLRADILRRDGYRCRMCGRAADHGITLHVDHIIPISRNGRSIPENLQTLCQDCNLGKSNRFVG